MQAQVLSPRMQNAEESDPGSEMPGVGCDFKHGLGAGAEEQIVEQPLVLENESGQLVRQGEDLVKVWNGQQFGRSRRQPLGARVPLALRAVPIAARNGVRTITCLMGSFSLRGVRC